MAPSPFTLSLKAGDTVLCTQGLGWESRPLSGTALSQLSSRRQWLLYSESLQIPGPSRHPTLSLFLPCVGPLGSSGSLGFTLFQPGMS